MNRDAYRSWVVFAIRVLALFLAALGGCSPRPSVEAAPREYIIRGIVRAIDLSTSQVIIEHEDVPGLMPAMTMPFHLRQPGDLNGVAVGEAIRFRFRMTEDASWAEGIERIDPRDLNLPSPALAVPDSGPTRLREGDRLEDFDLIDQAGRRITRATFSDRQAVLLSFIFVRCPVPEYCPLISRQMAEIERQVAADRALEGRVGLLSVSFDPADTPLVLAEYAARFARDSEVWRFATGTPEEIARLTQAFSVHVKPEAGSFSHELCTALLDATGRIVRLWRGNGWRPDEVMAALRDLLVKAPAPAVEAP